MNQNILVALYEYNAYANQVLLETVEKLTDDEQNRNVSPSYDSVRNLLIHMLAVEAFFLINCQGKPFPFGEDDLKTLANIKRHWAQLAKDQQAFIASLSEDDLKRTVHIKSRDHTHPMWQLLVQAFVHSTQHRGELSATLTRLGHPLPLKDPIIRFVEQSGQTWIEE